ncbi:hypothetical protein MY5147_005149 [Beauveria neobassiana]
MFSQLTITHRISFGFSQYDRYPEKEIHGLVHRSAFDYRRGTQTRAK